MYSWGVLEIDFIATVMESEAESSLVHSIQN